MSAENEPSRFTIRDGEDSPESLYLADADNLRIEKLSTKVTLIAILIPCLLVIILAVAYLDIKNRVISTQNTGSMGVQNLSKDLESRFSSLSLKQAKLEEQLVAHTKTLKNTTAAFQVNLKKAQTEFKQINDEKSDRSEIKALSQKSEKEMAALETVMTVLQKDMTELHDQMKELNAAFGKFDEELASQILLMAKGLKKDQGRLSEIETLAHHLESEKLSKESMNLALGLERLALQEMVKDRIRELSKKLTALNKQVDTLARKVEAQEKKLSQSPPSASLPSPYIHSSTSSVDSAQLEEQTIN